MTKTDKIYKIRCTYDMSPKNITFGMMPIRYGICLELNYYWFPSVYSIHPFLRINCGNYYPIIILIFNPSRTDVAYQQHLLHAPFLGEVSTQYHKILSTVIWLSFSLTTTNCVVVEQNTYAKMRRAITSPYLYKLNFL